MLRHAALYAALVSCASSPLVTASAPEPRRLVELPAILATALGEGAAPPSDGEIVSADGRTRTLCHPCAPDPSPPAGRVFSCTSTPEWPDREWSFEGAGRVIDVREEMALIARTRTLRLTERPENPSAREADGAVLYTEDVMGFELDRARWFTPRTIEPTANFTRVGFTGDGQIVGLARTGSTTLIVYGPIGELLRTIAIDRPGDDIARTASGDFVLTVGPRAFVVGSDGLSERAVTLPEGIFLSNPRSAPGPRRAGERIRCAANLCTLDGRAALRLNADRSLP